MLDEVAWVVRFAGLVCALLSLCVLATIAGSIVGRWLVRDAVERAEGARRPPGSD